MVEADIYVDKENIHCGTYLLNVADVRKGNQQSKNIIINGRMIYNLNNEFGIFKCAHDDDYDNIAVNIVRRLSGYDLYKFAKTPDEKLLEERLPF